MAGLSQQHLDALKRIEELEAENRAFKTVNEELCKAVNSGKHRRLLNALLKKSQ
jgi:hypothetical protein